jgi:hypothetical protein
MFYLLRPEETLKMVRKFIIFTRELPPGSLSLTRRSHLRTTRRSSDRFFFIFPPTRSLVVTEARSMSEKRVFPRCL